MSYLSALRELSMYESGEAMAATTASCPRCDGGVLERRGSKWVCKNCGARLTNAEVNPPAASLPGHNTNTRGSNWDTHTKPRAGRGTTKNRKKKGWGQREQEAEAELMNELEAELTLIQGGRTGSVRPLPPSPWPGLINQARARLRGALSLLRSDRTAHAADALSSAMSSMGQARSALQSRITGPQAQPAIGALNNAIQSTDQARTAARAGLRYAAANAARDAMGSLLDARERLPVRSAPRPPTTPTTPTRPPPEVIYRPRRRR